VAEAAKVTAPLEAVVTVALATAVGMGVAVEAEGRSAVGAVETAVEVAAVAIVG
jgi:hypothetical protein